jgi:2-hydroxy-4-carboxymuconate semialdehyde hemiacetal dehydrogenase
VFFRRENLNALGRPRDWTDHLLWHHACHTIDLFIHQTGRTPDASYILEGPQHPELGIAMDMSIGMASGDGALCTLALSFNHEGPFGTTFRYVCDDGTYVAEYDDLRTGDGEDVDLTEIGPVTDGIELQDREFVAAILEGREPSSSVAACLPAMETIDGLERMLSQQA